MFRLGRDKLREKRFSRSRQVTGWIEFLRRCDLVMEIGQTCDRSATVRPACRTLNRRMVTAAEPVYSTCSSKPHREGVCKRHDTSEQPLSEAALRKGQGAARHREAIIALARKLLGIIYRTLKNKWVFEDFPNFVLAEAA